MMSVQTNWDRVRYSKIGERLAKVKWNYHWNRVKDRWLYIVGGFALISIPWMIDWPIIGSFISTSQEEEIGLLPGQIGLLRILSLCMIYAIFSASWDILAGYSGQVSFGHALFFGGGSYIATFYMFGLTIRDISIGPFSFDEIVIFTSKNPDIQTILGIEMNITVLMAIITAGIVCAFIALIIGTISLRLKGPYFALVTLVLPLIFFLLVKDIWEKYTGGNQGIPSVPKLVQGTGDRLAYSENFYLVTLVFFVISISIISILARSRFGIVLQSIREDELAAAASGINVSRYKIIVYGISAFFGGISGALLSQDLGSSVPELFETDFSFGVIIYTVLGGIGSITGAVVGTFILYFSLNTYLDKAFIDIPTLETLSLGLILFLALRYQPYGLIRASKRFRNSLLSGVMTTVVITFYDAGKIIPRLSEKINISKWLNDKFSENGLFGLINVEVAEGRILIYFIFGVIIGYFGPELFRAIRLRAWGVWPSVGNYDPPK